MLPRLPGCSERNPDVARSTSTADDEESQPLSPVVIMGTGLVGASIGCALTAVGEDVRLRDRYRSHAVVAAGLGAGSVEHPIPTSVHLVVVAVPPQAVPEVVDWALSHYRNAVVTDVASVKAPVLADLRTRGRDLSRYVGSHPMAGSQYSGPLTATATLFVDRTWVVARGTGNEASQRMVERLAVMCGAHVVHLDADEHDRAVAEISHMPQLMSSLTAARLRDVPASDLLLAGQGVRDVTRIAGSDPALWRQIITANSTEIGTQLRAIRGDLDRLIDQLDDPDAIADLVERGREGVAALPGKHGRKIGDMSAVVVEIPDTPGALARLFTDIQAQGINIEDLSIEHGLSREVGYLSVAVDAERAPDLRAAMVRAGWDLRS
ncbi:prephenate dehydrogenase [Propionibacterium freudenreichii]|uniref:prephenate dehydrogenase n=2 Tax=Propionibacterium freudenreichii TaxID=1744 RepID=UPI0009B6BFFE|nr:prephenate dehydrogenase [Propionibacterium freudenreichii]MCT3007712.1 prephenate dehydrogenase [Propionibacterium freudenreichii]MCT3009145.1 prephenate dehydrogenase [Propionibacterium freudenreichii]MDK9296273.1 prephenate dehydrogenase [Propionibacterium freudenreichii]MDK9646651.1 prephenate dehydrogenase [Propionibacterium freudenreichii]